MTCVQLPEPDPDQDLLLRAIAGADLDPHLVAWDDPEVAWEDFDLAIIRSTWNYISQLDDFLTWIDRTSDVVPVWNPPGVIRWNCHKGYLHDATVAGLPAIPSMFLPVGSQEPLAVVMDQTGWEDVVLKPAVGAGSFLTDRVRRDDLNRGERLWRHLIDRRETLVQPYLPSVEEYGERSLVWIDGEFTHAVRKEPRLGNAEERTSAALEIATDERQLGDRVLDWVGRDLLYARVDLIRDQFGEPLIAEIEVVEPSLFLLQSPRALLRLVAAIANRTGGGH